MSYNEPKDVAGRRDYDQDANRDPITGAKGAHPVGVGLGAAGGGAAGAVVGSVAGPIGAAIGAGVGAVAGGLIGKDVAESIDPTAEDAFWLENYEGRPYVRSGVYYPEYQPAYRYGWESAARYPERSFEDLREELEREWDKQRGRSSLTWEGAKDAVRDAWDRVRSRDRISID